MVLDCFPRGNRTPGSCCNLATTLSPSLAVTANCKGKTRKIFQCSRLHQHGECQQECMSCRRRQRSVELSMPALAEVVLPHTSQTFAVTQPNNCGDETHLDGRVVSAFVFLSAAIAQLLSSTFVASTALTKGQQRSNNTSSFTDAYMAKLIVLTKL